MRIPLYLCCSGKEADLLAHHAVNDPDLVEQLITTLESGPIKEKTNASWIIGKLIELAPEAISSELLINQLTEKELKDGVKRNLLRALQFVSVPVHLQGKLLDYVLHILQKRDEAHAVKCFALTIAFNMVKLYPELGGELSSIIESQLKESPPSFKARARKIIPHLGLV